MPFSGSTPVPFSGEIDFQFEILQSGGAKGTPASVPSTSQTIVYTENDSMSSTTVPLPEGANFINLLGRTVGDLTFVDYLGRKSGKSYWTAVCVCGNEIKAHTSDVTCNPPRTSCGCKPKGSITLPLPRHAWWLELPEYDYWLNLWYIDKCLSLHMPRELPNLPDEWLDFDQFLEDVGYIPYPDKAADMGLRRRHPTVQHGPENSYWDFASEAAFVRQLCQGRQVHYTT